jgi:hypothetical protein
MNTLSLLAADPNASVHKACGAELAAKGACRMLSNDRLAETGVIEVGREIAMEATRAGRDAIVLIPQDATELNYVGLVKTTGLGEIGANPKPRGLLTRSAVAARLRKRKAAADRRPWNKLKASPVRKQDSVPPQGTAERPASQPAIKLKLSRQAGDIYNE